MAELAGLPDNIEWYFDIKGVDSSDDSQHGYCLSVAQLREMTQCCEPSASLLQQIDDGEIKLLVTGRPFWGIFDDFETIFSRINECESLLKPYRYMEIRYGTRQAIDVYLAKMDLSVPSFPSVQSTSALRNNESSSTEITSATAAAAPGETLPPSKEEWVVIFVRVDNGRQYAARCSTIEEMRDTLARCESHKPLLRKLDEGKLRLLVMTDPVQGIHEVLETVLTQLKASGDFDLPLIIYYGAGRKIDHYIKKNNLALKYFPAYETSDESEDEVSSSHESISYTARPTDLTADGDKREASEDSNNDKPELNSGNPNSAASGTTNPEKFPKDVSPVPADLAASRVGVSTKNNGPYPVPGRSDASLGPLKLSAKASPYVPLNNPIVVNIPKLESTPRVSETYTAIPSQRTSKNLDQDDSLACSSSKSEAGSQVINEQQAGAAYKALPDNDYYSSLPFSADITKVGEKCLVCLTSMDNIQCLLPCKHPLCPSCLKIYFQPMKSRYGPKKEDTPCMWCPSCDSAYTEQEVFPSDPSDLKMEARIAPSRRRRREGRTKSVYEFALQVFTGNDLNKSDAHFERVLCKTITHLPTSEEVRSWAKDRCVHDAMDPEKYTLNVTLSRTYEEWRNQELKGKMPDGNEEDPKRVTLFMFPSPRLFDLVRKDVNPTVILPAADIPVERLGRETDKPSKMSKDEVVRVSTRSDRVVAHINEALPHTRPALDQVHTFPSFEEERWSNYKIQQEKIDSSKAELASNLATQRGYTAPDDGPQTTHIDKVVAEIKEALPHTRPALNQVDTSPSFEEERWSKYKAQAGKKNTLSGDLLPPESTSQEHAGPVNATNTVTAARISSYGFKLKDTLESAPPTPPVQEPSVANKGFDTLQTKTAPAPSSDDLGAKANHPKPTLKQAYLRNCIADSANTPASSRLLTIMDDEDVSLDTPLGLKLLDLAKSLACGGDLAPVDSTDDANAETESIAANTTIESVDGRLNEFAAMLNAIAEAVGVNLTEGDDEIKSIATSDATTVADLTATPSPVPAWLADGAQSQASLASPLATPEVFHSRQNSAADTLADLVRSARRLDEQTDDGSVEHSLSPFAYAQSLDTVTSPYQEVSFIAPIFNDAQGQNQGQVRALTPTEPLIDRPEHRSPNMPSHFQRAHPPYPYGALPYPSTQYNSPFYPYTGHITPSSHIPAAVPLPFSVGAGPIYPGHQQAHPSYHPSTHAQAGQGTEGMQSMFSPRYDLSGGTPTPASGPGSANRDRDSLPSVFIWNDWPSILSNREGGVNRDQAMPNYYGAGAGAGMDSPYHWLRRMGMPWAPPAQSFGPGFGGPSNGRF